MNISLPSALKDYVDERVKAGLYGNTSDYIRDLIRADKQKSAEEHLEDLLLEGIDSGPSTQMTSSDWEGIASRVEQRIKAAKS